MFDAAVSLAKKMKHNFARKKGATRRTWSSVAHTASASAPPSPVVAASRAAARPNRLITAGGTRVLGGSSRVALLVEFPPKCGVNGSSQGT